MAIKMDKSLNIKIALIMTQNNQVLYIKLNKEQMTQIEYGILMIELFKFLLIFIIKFYLIIYIIIKLY